MNLSITALISLVIFVLILTALAPTIIEKTDTHTCPWAGENTTGCALENASGSAVSMFNLVELLYPVIGIFGVLALVGIGRARS